MAASKAMALLLALNLVFFTMVTAQPITTCPITGFDVKVCANVLGLVFLGISIGPGTGSDCCTPFTGLVDAQVTVCLCNSLHTGTFLDSSVVVNAVLGYCGRPEIPSCGPYIHS